jgi:glycosyltransferase involved in cell wall biosynthesis
VIEKDPRQVIHSVAALEHYLDQYLETTGLTFEQWVHTFGQGSYRDRNVMMLEVTLALRPRNVLEFACAGPFLARLLVERIPSIERYTCSNFSPRMVDFLAAQLAGEPRCSVALIDADVRRSPDMHRDRLQGYDTFVTTSLEHIQFDRELVEELPIGSIFVFCVARFDDPEHFRIYETLADVQSRYADLLRIVDARQMSDGQKLVVATVRHEDGAPSLPAKPAEISVIVPCRNAGPHFRPGLESLVSQVVRERAEILVVDNGSTDGSRSIAESVSGLIPVKVVDAPRPANAAHARNVGVRAASGEKLFFVDADDEIAPGYLRAMSAALDRHGFVTSRVDSETLNPEWVRAAHGAPWQAEGVDRFFQFMPGTGINVGVRRALFEAVGGFPVEFSGSQDIVFSWRVQLAGTPVHFVPEALYRYRYRATLRGLFRQARNWGTSNVLLYRQFREAGMPGRSLREAVKEWRGVLISLARARSRAALARTVVRLGYCIGRAIGTVRYRCCYL